jgi:hypothetical protein
MEIDNFLKSLDRHSVNKIVKIFKDISEESSPTLLKQLDDRLRKYNERIRHIQFREAKLKDKLMGVSSLLEEAKDKKVDNQFIKILEQWHGELLEMLGKIDYGELEGKRMHLVKVRDKIRVRAPLVSKVLEEYGNGATA